MTRPLVDLDEVLTAVTRITLLEPDGTPTDRARWDRLVRFDGKLEAAARTVWLTLADGEPGFWQWIADHVAPGPEPLLLAPVSPIAVEHFAEYPDLGWVRHLLPRLDLHEIGEPPLLPDGAWPVWQWHGVPNPRWPEQPFRETPLAWSTVVDGRPDDAPPPATRRELEAAAAE